MSIEFERKFFIDVDGIPFEEVISTHHLQQGYICADDHSIVRIRNDKSDANTSKWYITIKQDMKEPGKNHEFEYEVSDASDLFSTLTRTIVKTRRCIPIKNTPLVIELDQFHDKHKGLWIAEVELASDEESDLLNENMPTWFTEEITGNRSYSNYQLSKAECHELV